jgi:hypothetical protein
VKVSWGPKDLFIGKGIMKLPLAARNTSAGFTSYPRERPCTTFCGDSGSGRTLALKEAGLSRRPESGYMSTPGAARVSSGRREEWASEIRKPS